MKKTAHIVSHSHWDREWYLPFEQHRYYFIKLINDIIQQFEDEKNEFSSFHLDGQTVLLEDYYDVHPEKKSIVEKLIKEKKLHIGPWYVLQDAYLTSSEANVRNLLVGMYDSSLYGEVSKLGYFPDTFGIYGQAPQILKQAGIESAAFGRGVKPTGFNNTVSDAATFESPFSEMEWEAPDGSRVLGILFANWYSNGNEVPADKDDAKAFWDKKLSDSEKYASTNHLLFMNGCDHQPLQKNIPEALKVASELYPDYEFKHSDFETYINEVRKTLPEEIQVINGELRNQRTDGWSTLVNTASARIYLKQWNHLCQTQLEKIAEPIATMNFMSDGNYQREYLRFMWKSLMKNHPHDSICGCSVDSVHREMVSRFESVSHMTEVFIKEQAIELANKINTCQGNKSGIPLVAVNTTGWDKNEVIESVVDIEKVYFSNMHFESIPEYLSTKKTPNFNLVDSNGDTLEVQFESESIEFDYDLPDDKFRQPYFAKRLKLSFLAPDIPAFGYKTFYLVETTGDIEFGVTEDKFDMNLENEFVSMQFNKDGSYNLTDKNTGHSFKDLGIYEDTGDVGNEYMFKESTGMAAITTKGLEAQFKLVEKSALRTVVEIKHNVSIPISADVQLDDERNKLIWHKERTAGRSDVMTSFALSTLVILEKGKKGPAFKLTMQNNAKDHRFRVLFPTMLETTYHHADSIFEIVSRSNTPEKEWENPSNCFHQQKFASVSDGKVGLTVATFGLQEYEVLRENSEIAVTVLRSVAELGDWGYFPTPEAQCLGEQTAEWMVIPHAGDVIQSEVYIDAYQYKVPVVITQTTCHEGILASDYQFICTNAPGLSWSSLKVSENRDDVIVRWFNPSNDKKKLEIENYMNVYESNIVESDSSSYKTKFDVNHHQIFTVGLKK